MSERERDLQIIRGTDGALWWDGAQLLYDLARCEAKDGVIVEIGSWKGLSTVALALGSMRGERQRVFSIDPHEEWEGTEHGPERWGDWYNNILRAGVSHFVRPIGLFSQQVDWRTVDLPISLAFIDGHPHTYEQTIADVDVLLPWLTEDGLLVFDDTDMEGVAKAVAELEGGVWERYTNARRVVALKRKWGAHDEREYEAEASRQADEGPPHRAGDDEAAGGDVLPDPPAGEPDV